MIFQSKAMSFVGIASSNMYLLSQGRTKLARLFTIIKRSPMARIFLFGQMMVLKTWATVTRGLVESDIYTAVKLNSIKGRDAGVFSLQ
jgi:hypothetical protein